MNTPLGGAGPTVPQAGTVGMSGITRRKPTESKRNTKIGLMSVFGVDMWVMGGYIGNKMTLVW